MKELELIKNNNLPFLNKKLSLIGEKIKNMKNYDLIDLIFEKRSMWLSEGIDKNDENIKINAWETMALYLILKLRWLVDIEEGIPLFEEERKNYKNLYHILSQEKMDIDFNEEQLFLSASNIEMELSIEWDDAIFWIKEAKEMIIE